ncbi:MAG: Trk system potassium transporter TrkA [Bacteroidales bacterium]|nr:Trk system potassium transporter TrkA [Bacteroidales bacterium]
MKIIVAGAGEVGRHLAKMLSREKHNIVVLDLNGEVLANLNTNYDFMTLVGSPVSIEKLKEAGAKSADLLIAVTPDESRNMTACILATKLGAKKTVARIDNPEYLEESNKAFFEQLGIDSLIYPEKLAAEEIINSLKRPWTRQWHEFCGGKLILVSVKVRSNASILEKSLVELFKNENTYRIAVIKRQNRTLIPTGKDMVLVGDLVFFISTPEAIETIRKICGKSSNEIHNVMIMGGSRIAIKTSHLLSNDFNVKIIEQNRDRAEWLMERVDSNTSVIVGDGRDVDLLASEGIEKTDAFVALTGSAETNILSCLAAKNYHIHRTIAEVENIDYIAMAEGLDIGMIINKKLISAGHIYQMMLEADVSNVKSLAFADAEVAEFVVNKKAKITRTVVKNLDIPENISLGGLVRKGKGMLIYGDTQIQEGDHVVVFCPNSSIQHIEKFFQ